ncbi:MAG: Gfo/Idh/MocA family oxidoreductase [Armatimonadetes bacterium]|nr:Gfo/Idh/MocA family oxidoreductase [Armatimonadota bacterium]
MPDIELDYLPHKPPQIYPIGAIGAGFIMKDCHLVAYRKAGFPCVAIASRSRERAEEAACERGIPKVYDTVGELLEDEAVQIVDIAVPPHEQIGIVRQAVKHSGHIRGILAQKPLGMNGKEAAEIVRLCGEAGIVLAVNQNMRYDQSMRALKSLLAQGELGQPVLATIEMRAIPHWMPWQQLYGWATLRIMSIHHIDIFRFLFGDPERIYASTRPDPRTRFPHRDGICLYILEYADGLRCCSWDDVWTGPSREGAEKDIYIKWRVEGTEGMAWGTIGWPDYPHPTPSTLHLTTVRRPEWFVPRWPEVWFPDAFEGPMAQLMTAIATASEPEIGGRDNLKTMALVDAAYLSATEHRAVGLSEMMDAR